LEPSDLQDLPVAGFLSKPLSEEKVAQVLQEHFGQSVNQALAT
jgi:hypothetical protein